MAAPADLVSLLHPEQVPTALATRAASARPARPQARADAQHVPAASAPVVRMHTAATIAVCVVCRAKTRLLSLCNSPSMHVMHVPPAQLVDVDVQVTTARAARSASAALALARRR